MIRTIVEIKKSGNRFNAWDADGNKFTSQISGGLVKELTKMVWLLSVKLTKVVRSFGVWFP